MRVLLTSILNQKKLAHELLGALGQGKGPLDKLVKKVSLQHAGPSTAPPRWRSRRAKIKAAI